MSLVIRLLGPVEIEVDGRPLKVDTKKAVALLAYLAASGQPQDREHLVDLLWPDYEEDRGRATLRRTLSALKSGVGEGWIEVDRTRVGVKSTDMELDLARLTTMEDLHAHAAGESCPDCLTRLEEIVSVHRGDFMQGFILKHAPGFEEWQVAQNEIVRRAMGTAFDRLIEAAAALGNDDVALAAAEKRIKLDPLNEPTYRSLMRIHARKGERGGVVDAYRSLVAVLERELGVPPLEETTELYRALSRGAHPAPPITRSESTSDTGRLPFVGRSREWDRLVTAYQGAAPQVVGIEGEAGIGKTRLIEEFLDHVSAIGTKTVIARSHEGESNVAYGVLSEALRNIVTSRVAAQLSEVAIEELARLLPELDTEPAQSPVASRFYEAVRSAFEEGLRGDRPGVVVFEDVHWSDAATLEVLAYISRRINETGIFLVCTWRPEEVRNAELLLRIQQHASATHLRLGRFGRNELAHLIDQVGISVDRDPTITVTRLLEETEGVPYFVTEYVKSLRSGGTWDVPSTVRELVTRRVASASDAATQILDAAAVIDRAVDFDVVCRVSGRTDLETADALDELSDIGLMKAIEDATHVRYEFSHEKVRTVAYERMSPARRHVLHRRAAENLVESVGSEPDGASAAAIARHFELAGAADAAADYHRRAGRWALSVFAHSQSLEHFRRAQALGDASAEVHESIADIHVLQGDYAAAIASYETAAALAAEPEAIDRKLGSVYLRRGEYDIAEAHLSDALERSKDDTVTTGILVDLSLAARRRGLHETATKHAGEAVERAARSEDPALRARAENAAGMLASADGRAKDARNHLQTAFDMATAADDLPALVAALNNLALVERREGNIEDAIELTRRALEAGRRFGDRHREAALENNLADLLHEHGDQEQAMEHLKRATAIFAEIGNDPEGPLPEVWKLVEW